MCRTYASSEMNPILAQNSCKGGKRTLRFLIWCIAWLLASCTHTSGKTPPKVVDGVIDVSGWDFARDGSVSLLGEWRTEDAAGLGSGTTMVPWGEVRAASVPVD